MYARRATRPKPRTTQPKKWDAPVAGWVANRALSTPESLPGPGAAVLDNFFPKTTTVALRRGCLTVATAGETDVTALFAYNNGTIDKLFAATATAIYDVSTLPDPTLPDAGPAIVGAVASSPYTGGDWVVTQFAATGATFLVGVNGMDAGFSFNGTTFAALAITFPGGLTTADMAYVWVYKNRLFFARKGTMDAYYLPVDAVAGAATAFPLAGVFSQGGELMFGAPWSLDSSGDGGLSEQCAFISSEGEVAVYQGTDPSSAATWSKVGIYRIGAPLGRKAFLRGGGDLAIATTVGLVPLSKAVTLDIAALNVAAVSYKIADAWSEAVTRNAYGWQCCLWSEQKTAVVAINDPNSRPIIFVSNAETGAWARYTGWTVKSLATFKGNLYFGSTEGRVIRASAGGSDDGATYTGAVLPLFEDMATAMSSKLPTVGRARVLANIKIAGQVTVASDFNIFEPTAPNATIPTGLGIWEVGEWGLSIWSAVRPSVINQDWQSLGGGGYSISMWYQVTSGAVFPIDAELIGLEMLFETTEALG